MSKLQELKDNLMTARRNKAAAMTTLYSTLIGEVDRIRGGKDHAKKTEDQLVAYVLTKTKEGLVERRDLIEADVASGKISPYNAFEVMNPIVNELREVNLLVEQMVPKKLSAEEMELSVNLAFKAEVAAGTPGNKLFGKIMGHLNAVHGDALDKAAASAVVKFLVDEFNT